MPTRPDPRGWFGPALALVAVVTALRWGLLAFNRTDLFVDESQYWLWGQEFAFGYYSKPPLIAWVIGGVTALAGSDAPFWVRMPGAALHGAAALILAAWAARMWGARLAVWVAAAYVTLPMVAVGSLLISTDTVMAPFFAAALYFHHRLTETPRVRFAVLAGLMAGLAFLAKYAAVYFLLGVAIAALLDPAMRLRMGHVGAMLAGFGAAILPNLAWNVQNSFATVSHTMDNVGWVRQQSWLSGLDPVGMAEFVVSQFGVFGPVLFAAFLVAVFRPRGRVWLLAFSLPALGIVTLQGLLEKAYANWAASAYFAGTLTAVHVLAGRPGLLRAAVAVNAAICVALPLVTVLPGPLTDGALQRYLGRADLSRQIIAAAHQAGDVPVVAEKRDVLADLFYTGARSGLRFYAPRPAGRPQNHYEQTHALPAGLGGPVLFIGALPRGCTPLAGPSQPFQTTGAYAGKSIVGILVSAECLDAAG